MTEQLHVRVGTPADVHRFMDLCIACGQENGLLEFNVEKMLNEVWASLHQDHGLVGIIGPEDGAAEAGILLRIDSMRYSADPVLTEVGLFVCPEYRAAKGGRASRLCEFAKQVSDDINMPLLIGVLSSERAAGKVRLYERHFGEPAGAYWLYGAKTGKKHLQAAE